MKTEKAYIKLRDQIIGLEADVKKFESGTKAAGRRIRKGLQGIKKDAQALRLSIQEEVKTM